MVEWLFHMAIALLPMNRLKIAKMYWDVCYLFSLGHYMSKVWYNQNENNCVIVLDLKKTENKFLSVATSPKIPHAATMFYSLLNVIMNYDPTGILPYSSVLASDPQEQLVEVAAHVLCCLLHYKPETIQSSTDQDKQEQKVSLKLITSNLIE